MSDPYEDMADDVKKIHDNIEAMKEKLGRGQDSDRDDEEIQGGEKETGKPEESMQDEQPEEKKEELKEKLEKTRKSAEDLWNTVEGTDSSYPGFRLPGEDEKETEESEEQDTEPGTRTGEGEETAEKPASSDEQEFRENVKQALEYAQEGDLEEARREYRWLSQRFRSLKAKDRLGKEEAKMLEKLRDRVDLAKEG